MIRFDHGPVLLGQMRIAKLKVLITCLLLVLEVCNVNQLIGNHGLGTSDVVRFDNGPLLGGQTRIAKVKVLITCLLLVLDVCNVKPTYRKTWAGNLLIWSALALGPSCKVKQWFTGFDELHSGGSNLHRCSDELGLVIFCFS